MKFYLSLLLALLLHFYCNCQSDFIVSEGSTLGGMYIESDTLYVVSSSDRAHAKSIISQDSDYDTFNLALQGPDFYNYRDICKIDNFLFVTKYGSPWNGEPGIYRRDLSDENGFFQLYLSINGAYGLAARDQELYVNAGNSIYKVDTSNDNADLVLVNSNIFDYTFGLGTLALKVLGDFLYVVDDSGISKIDLNDENYALENISEFSAWGIALKDDTTAYLTFSDALNESGAVYKLDFDTQETTLLYNIEGFFQSYDIEYYNDLLFVTTLSGANDKVVKLDVNALSTNEFDRKTPMIFPNPTSSILNIKNLEDVNNINIYDLNGRLIKEFKTPKRQIDVSMLVDGIYILRVDQNYIRFVKQS
jgi:hypothetical protein